MADKKISEMATASAIDNDDNLELSHSVNGGFTSLKASILAIATKMLTAINFTSALQTTDKTVIGAINEVAQGGGGGGSDVEWTQIVQSGTKIAEIEIDGNTTNVYAPSGGSGSINYSTTEQDTGVKWINGETIYQKTVYSAGGTTGEITISHGISNLAHCIYAEGWFHDTYSSGFDSPLPKLDALHNDIGITEVNSTSVKCNVPSAYGDGRIIDIYITLRYTKSTT